MHGKVTKHGGKGAISTWKLLNYKVNSVCLTSERNTYKKGNFFQMGDLDAVRSGDGTRIPLKLNNAV